MTPSGVEPATFLRVAQCPNYLRHYGKHHRTSLKASNCLTVGGTTEH
jgi:hypothetical protein